VHSKKLNPIEDAAAQMGLLLSRRAQASSASVESIARKPNLLSAINYCIDESGLDDNEIRLALQIDPGHWSNIRKGKAGHHFPTNKLDDLMTLCGNEIPLIWQALKRGKGLHLLETEAERQLRIAEARAERAEIKLLALQEAVSGRFAGVTP
jgi:hypothetical protein